MTGAELLCAELATLLGLPPEVVREALLAPLLALPGGTSAPVESSKAGAPTKAPKVNGVACEGYAATDARVGMRWENDRGDALEVHPSAVETHCIFDVGDSQISLTYDQAKEVAEHLLRLGGAQSRGGGGKEALFVEVARLSDINDAAYKHAAELRGRAEKAEAMALDLRRVIRDQCKNLDTMATRVARAESETRGACEVLDIVKKAFGGVS